MRKGRHRAFMIMINAYGLIETRIFMFRIDLVCRGESAR